MKEMSIPKANFSLRATVKINSKFQHCGMVILKKKRVIPIFVLPSNVRGFTSLQHVSANT